MTETEFADYLRDICSLSGSSLPQDTAAVLRTAADMLQCFAHGTVDTIKVAEQLQKASAQYSLSPALYRAAERVWTDRFAETGEHYGFADRHTVSKGCR